MAHLLFARFRSIHRWLSIVLLVAIHGALLAVHDLGNAPWTTVGLLAVAFLVFVWAVWSHEPNMTLVKLLMVAVLIRILCLPLPPTLSDDILRYRWDGRVATAGFDPYRLSPEDPELTALRDTNWQEMPHKEIPTVYPPAALGLFSIASLLPGSLETIKILLTLCDMLTCWLLWHLARAANLPVGRVAWYAWNPLVALEVAGMGHIDALMVTAVVATGLAIVKRRVAAAGVAAAIGILAKLVPLVALPLWARLSGKPWRFAMVVGTCTTLATAPFLLRLGGPPPGLVAYGVRWEFNGPAYEPLWRLYDLIALDVRVKAGLDALKQRTTHHEALNHIYPLIYPQLLAKATLGVVLVPFLAWAWRARDPIVGTGKLLGGALLCSATFYPWYVLCVLPFAALARQRAWILLSALLPLSYIPQRTEQALMPWIYLAIWLPFAVLVLREPWSTD